MSKRLLIVDDNRDAAESLTLLLELGGHDIAVAHTGNDALTAAADFSPDIVLLDIDGYEVARRLRQLPAGDRLTIAALTGYGQTRDREAGLAAGFDAHFVKPVDIDAIERFVEGADGR